MNWIELRPKLQEQFGRTFSFYNDKYKSGIRRIKISYAYPQNIIDYVKTIAPELDTKHYGTYTLTIHYNK
jgi:hypothetical protein